MELWRRYLDWRRRHVAVIVLTPDGFRLIYGAASHAARWSSIRQITAFKRDVYTHDCVCLLLAVPETVIEIREDMEGFASFREGMERHFDIAPTWFLDTMGSPFDTSPRDLYRHPDFTEPSP